MENYELQELILPILNNLHLMSNSITLTLQNRLCVYHQEQKCMVIIISISGFSRSFKKNIRTKLFAFFSALFLYRNVPYSKAGHSTFLQSLVHIFERFSEHKSMCNHNYNPAS